MQRRFSYWIVWCCSLIGMWYVQPSYAQSLGEDVGVRWVYGQLLRTSTINGAYGVGRLTRLYNQPADHISSYRWNTNNGMTPQYGFGGLSAIPSWHQQNHVQVLGSLWNEWDVSGKLSWKKRKDYPWVDLPNGQYLQPFTEVRQRLFVNGHWNAGQRDRGGDGFLEQPTKQRIIVDSQTDIERHNFSVGVGLGYFYLNENGGETAFDRSEHYLGNTVFGIGQRQEYLTGKLIAGFDLSDDDHIDMDIKYDYTDMNRFWGERLYDVQDHIIDANLNYHLDLPNALDDFYFGLNYDYRDVRETLTTTNEEGITLDRKESNIMGSFRMISYLQPNVLLNFGGSIGLHNLGGISYAPYLRLNYTIRNGMGISLFGKGGMRYANPLDEYASLFLSNRTVRVLEPLEREDVWIYGLSFRNSEWIWNSWHWDIRLDASHKYFTNFILADLDTQPYDILFYNTTAQQTVVSIDNLLSMRQWAWSTSYRFDYSRARTLNEGMPRMALSPMHRIGTGLSWQLYTYDSPVDVSTNFYVLGNQRFPDVSMKPISNGFEYRQWETRWDMKVNLVLSQIFQWDALWSFRTSLTLGVDNILNTYQETAFMNGDAPFGRDFDGGLMNEALLGRRFYAGLKVGWR